MNDTYVAALVGMGRVGAGELVAMSLPESGSSPEWLYRTYIEDGRELRSAWEQWGDPDFNIYPYQFRSIEPVASG